MVNIFFKDKTTTGLTIAVIALAIAAIYFYNKAKKGDNAKNFLSALESEENLRVGQTSTLFTKTLKEGEKACAKRDKNNNCIECLVYIGNGEVERKTGSDCAGIQKQKAI